MGTRELSKVPLVLSVMVQARQSAVSLVLLAVPLELSQVAAAKRRETARKTKELSAVPPVLLAVPLELLQVAAAKRRRETARKTRELSKVPLVLLVTVQARQS